ncbi:hypothetical protein C8R47DRAFT_1217431 [Mycena vitilis]|nr:hypothetical protein C8R47DRAFT_1217431 [Mycena vitilis]
MCLVLPTFAIPANPELPKAFDLIGPTPVTRTLSSTSISLAIPPLIFDMPQPTQSRSDPSKPKLDTAIQRAIQKTIGSSHIPLRQQLVLFGLLPRIQAAAAKGLERYHTTGDLMLQTCFVSVMFSRPSSERPLGHLATLKLQVLSQGTLAQFMKRAGLEAAERIAADGLLIFVGALFWRFDYSAVLLWFKNFSGPIIGASDEAYMAARLPGDLDDIQAGISDNAKLTTAEKSMRFSKAVGLLSSDPEPQPTLSMHRKDPILAVAEAELPFLAMRKLMETARNFIWDEGVAFYNAAFPDGALALAAEVPAAFTKGWLSAVATESQPRATKRKAAASVDLPENGLALRPRARSLPTFS